MIFIFTFDVCVCVCVERRGSCPSRVIPHPAQTSKTRTVRRFVIPVMMDHTVESELI